MSSKSPGPAKRKQFQLKILMLDDSEVPFQVDVSRMSNKITCLDILVSDEFLIVKNCIYI